MRILHDGVSITGRRSNNEDALLELPDRGLFAVADGMGGYEGGEIASKAALASLAAYCELLDDSGLGVRDLERPDGERVVKERLARAIEVADREVRRRAVGTLSRMGTTLACLAVGPTRAAIAHVGDSRVYRLREGEVIGLTRDHSLVNEMRAAGLSAAIGGGGTRLKNIITQALGQGREVSPDLRVVDVLPGDRFLLCSDGLTDVLDDEAIGWAMTSKHRVARALTDAAYAAGSHDNITALVVTIAEG
ncbi:MAG: serine/threonine-protein phosphatase [Sandaracinaceae bacterium]|nr:serine/threonine-protein phosphatase [Sandaracinaceae bacterium]